MVFVCENNLYSVYSDLSVRQPPGRQVFELARAYGMPAWQADGNQVEVVHDLVSQAVERARAGQGPTFLEFMTYRWREHCGPNYDDHLGYRPEQEFADWKLRCPLTTLEARLQAEGILDPGAIERLRADIGREIDGAFAFAKASPPPPPEMLRQHLFAPAEGMAYLQS